MRTTLITFIFVTTFILFSGLEFTKMCKSSAVQCSLENYKRNKTLGAFSTTKNQLLRRETIYSRNRSPHNISSHFHYFIGLCPILSMYSTLDNDFTVSLNVLNSVFGSSLFSSRLTRSRTRGFIFPPCLIRLRVLVLSLLSHRLLNFRGDDKLIHPAQ